MPITQNGAIDYQQLLNGITKSDEQPQVLKQIRQYNQQIRTFEDVTQEINIQHLNNLKFMAHFIHIDQFYPLAIDCINGGEIDIQKYQQFGYTLNAFQEQMMPSLQNDFYVYRRILLYVPTFQDTMVGYAILKHNIHYGHKLDHYTIYEFNQLMRHEKYHQRRETMTWICEIRCLQRAIYLHLYKWYQSQTDVSINLYQNDIIKTIKNASINYLAKS